MAHFYGFPLGKLDSDLNIDHLSDLCPDSQKINRTGGRRTIHSMYGIFAYMGVVSEV